MADNVLGMLASTAGNAFDVIEAALLSVSGQSVGGVFASDPLLGEAQYVVMILSSQSILGFDDLVTLLLEQPEFEAIRPIEGQLDAMIMTPVGGYRTHPRAFIRGLFSSAFLQIYLQGMSLERSTFARVVMQNYEELTRALGGGKVRTMFLSGYSGITFNSDKKIRTPWGEVTQAREPRQARVIGPFAPPKTTIVLSEERLMPVVFDRAEQPTAKFDNELVGVGASDYLLPLAFALSPSAPDEISVPISRWNTSITPFQLGFGFSTRGDVPAIFRDMDFSNRIDKVESWAVTVANNHSTSVDVAARRLVSAIGYRRDRSDALIDAVMVWENLLGTSSEVTFRVSAALAKLIKSTPVERRELKKELSKIYGMRSRIVHGEAVEPNEAVQAAAAAIQYAIMGLRECYLRGPEWLSLKSSERSDTLLLE